MNLFNDKNWDMAVRYPDASRPLHSGETVGGDGITRTVKSYFGYDPDGYLIEVNERILPEKLMPAARRAASNSRQ